jgi:hypothetical protein
MRCSVSKTDLHSNQIPRLFSNYSKQSVLDWYSQPGGIENEIGVTLPLRTVLEEPTIAELALVIEGLFISEIEDLTDEEITQLVVEFE